MGNSMKLGLAMTALGGLVTSRSASCCFFYHLSRKDALGRRNRDGASSRQPIAERPVRHARGHQTTWFRA